MMSIHDENLAILIDLNGEDFATGLKLEAV